MKQLNLRLDKKYTIVGSFYTELESGVCCDNCGRPIANCCEVVDSDEKKHVVGMDCAKTLSGVKDTLEYMQADADFAQAKQAVAKIKKFKKQFPEAQLTTKEFEDANNYWKEKGAGMWHIEFRDERLHRNWQSYPERVWKNYVLPMIQKLK